MQWSGYLTLGIIVPLLALLVVGEIDNKKKHRHHHHNSKHGHGHHAGSAGGHSLTPDGNANESSAGALKTTEVSVGVGNVTAIVAVANKEEQLQQGSIKVNGPLPADFGDRFVKTVVRVVDSDPSEVKVSEVNPVAGTGMYEIVFAAPLDVVYAVEDQAANPASKLATSELQSFLVQRGSASGLASAAVVEPNTEVVDPPPEAAPPNPVEDKGIDIDTAMPYGDLEAFGREDTAQELTESSRSESDAMVDQLERAEVAEEKRAVFRALTRLRGTMITAFDGSARAQTGNIDEYNMVHKWRRVHPVRWLAEEESDISKWAFPDSSEF